MVCKKSIKFKVVMLFAIFLFVSIFALKVRGAVPSEYDIIGISTWNYQGQDYIYARINSMEDATLRWKFTKPLYLLSYYKGSNVWLLCSREYFEVNTYSYYWDEWHYTSTLRSQGGNGFYYLTTVSGGFTDYPYINASSVDLESPFKQYFNSDSFVPIEQANFLKPFDTQEDNSFQLLNLKGNILDNVFSASWQLPFNLRDNITSMPLFIEFFIEDTDTGTSKIYYYPAWDGIINTDRGTFFDCADLELSMDVTKIKDLPTNFHIKSVTFTPYYEITIPTIGYKFLYRGNKGTILLNFNGTYEGTLFIPADIPDSIVPDENDTDYGLFSLLGNFFSGFFSNFGNMLKDLFIPTKEQMQSLFADMENFFSDKLGFLWFPFDLAITIVETFTYGDSNSMITLPPISINILGGVDLFEGAQFDMDAVGIFPYVRMVSSLVLACSVAGLAYNKWDEWIGGHDK